MQRQFRYVDEPEIVMASVPAREALGFIGLALEIAEELELYIDREYSSRDHQPVQMRRYERDMDQVRQLRATAESLTETSE